MKYNCINGNSDPEIFRQQKFGAPLRNEVWNSKKFLGFSKEETRISQEVSGS